MAALNGFLRTSRAHVGTRRSSPPKAGARPPSPSSGRPVHVVLGNEAADLDSTACAIALAYLRHKQHPDPHWVPVINIPRADFSLRTDVSWLVKHLGVDDGLLTFADEIDLPKLNAEKRLQLVLVDHNRLAAHQETLGSAVVECIDHHADEGLHASTLRYKHIEVVGSCASLVTEEFAKAKSQQDLLPEIIQLLLGAILIDTFNFDPQTTRATPKDREMAALLRGLLPNFSSDELFKNLWHEKTNLSRLSSMDLLRRDYKEFEYGAGRVGCSSQPVALAACFDRADFISEMQKYIDQQRLLFLLINTAHTLAGGALERELLLYRGQASEAMMEKLIRHLESNAELKLEARKNPVADERMRVYVQHNISASRKQLVPIVSNFFKASL